MAIDSVAAAVAALRQHQLLEPAQLNELAAEARRCPDVRTLAQLLIKKNWLTAYQVNQLVQGQGGNLTLGQYRLLEKIGAGGMGQVYKARHQAMGRIVALKVIRRDRLESEYAVKRFFKEIQAVGRLAHPNIVRAFDADTVNGLHFFAMEYVEGIDLSQLVKQQGPLPVQQACDCIRQAALGLQHAHDIQMVHRDIKPGNLLLSRSDPGGSGGAASGRTMRIHAKPIIKILDMGLARFDDDESNAGHSLSREGAVMGTPDYMAPEQAKNARGVDWRVDIYSLGCTFYYLLTGKVPFPGGTNIEKLLHHQMDQPKPVEQFRQDVPAGALAILKKMLAKRREERFQSAGDVAPALSTYSDTVSHAGATGRFQRPKVPAAAAVISGQAPQTKPAIREAPVARLAPPGAGPAVVVRPPARARLLRQAPVASLQAFFFDKATQRVRISSLLILLGAFMGVLGLILVLLTVVAELVR